MPAITMLHLANIDVIEAGLRAQASVEEICMKLWVAAGVVEEVRRSMEPSLCSNVSMHNSGSP